MEATRSGYVRFHSSPQPPGSSPACCNCVPIAPSPSRTRVAIAWRRGGLVFPEFINRFPERDDVFLRRCGRNRAGGGKNVGSTRLGNFEALTRGSLDIVWRSHQDGV